MKMTAIGADTLLEEARKIANREKTTFEALIEEGLRLEAASERRD
jgi:hypothetical protein